MERKIKMLRKRSRKKRLKNKLDLSLDQVLIFSAIMIIIFTTIMIIAFWQFQVVPDSLIVAFFGAFGLEGGYCAFIHKLKKEREARMNTMRVGDITGFDDAEVLNVPDEPDDGDLQIDLSEEGGSDGLVDQ